MSIYNVQGALMKYQRTKHVNSKSSFFPKKECVERVDF